MNQKVIKNKFKLFVQIFSLIFIFINLLACNKSIDSFSLLMENSFFKQSTNYQARKIDILWVIDNSGSMETSQTSLAQNFQSFIQNFKNKNFDFQMAFTTTDAYSDYYYSNSTTYSRFKDGSNTHSGIYIIDKNTPNIEQVFMTNVMLGINGSGDERAFSSFEKTLTNPLNMNFHRPDAFLAVIIVSDEDDFSHYDWSRGTQSYFMTENYSQSSIYPISHFTDYLNTFTQSQQSLVKNYSVNAIAIFDETCRNQLNNTFTGRKIAQRYGQLIDATQGTKISLCDQFSQSLNFLSAQILTLSSEFHLDREPIANTIRVLINGTFLASDSVNGWTYDSSKQNIMFHGSGIPPADANVIIQYDPVTIKE